MSCQGIIESLSLLQNVIQIINSFPSQKLGPHSLTLLCPALSPSPFIMAPRGCLYSLTDLRSSIETSSPRHGQTPEVFGEDAKTGQ